VDSRFAPAVLAAGHNLVTAFSAAVRGVPWTGASIHDGVRVVALTNAARESSGLR